MEPGDERCRTLRDVWCMTELRQRVRRRVRRERGQHRQAKCSAELLRRVEQSRGESRIARLDIGRRDQRDGDERETHADGHRHQAGEQVAQIRAGDRNAAEDEQTHRSNRHARDADCAHADAADQLL